MKTIIMMLCSVALLSGCAHTSRVSDDGDLSGSSYSYAGSSPSYNNGNYYHAPAQTTAAKMISPVAGF